MNILVTGHRGRLGPEIVRRLEGAGHAVRGFDLAEGGDIRDAAAVRAAARGMDAIVHIAGLAGDRGFPAADMLMVNLGGTGNVLAAAEAEAVRRVVYISSGRSLGLLERLPDSLPLDDDHRGLPAQPYALSKWLAEEMCAAYSQRTAIETVCLRPVAVFDEADYRRAMAGTASPPPAGRTWHLSVHVDVRDVAAAVAAAVTAMVPKHSRLLLCAADCAGDVPTLDLVRRHAPDVPWHGGPEYAAEPFRALVDCRRAKAVLGWTPRYPWPTRRSAEA